MANTADKSLKERLEALDIPHSSPISTQCPRCQIDAIAQALQEQADEMRDEVDSSRERDGNRTIFSSAVEEWSLALAPRREKEST